MIFAGTKKKDTRLSILLALIFNVAVLLLVYSFKWKIPDPPPADTTVELSMADFGYTDTGGGNTEGTPAVNSTPTEATPEEAIVDDSSDISNDVQETPATDSQPTQTQTTTQAEPQETQQQTSNALNNAISSMNNGNDGPENEPGNQGTQDGKIDGKGVFGNGSGWSMSGRDMTGEPRFNGTPTKNGKVQVRITVGKDGKVRSAKIVHTPPTNTSEQSLFDLALHAAKTAKFNKDSEAAINQSGTITFVFKVN